MIDRITIYIDDVKFEDVEKRLGLTPSKVAEDESLIYSSLISNLRFTYKGNRLTITGSLHKYAKGNNYSLFTYEEAKAVLLKLSDITNIPLKYFIVTSIELGVNFQMNKDVSRYLNTIHSYKSNRFIPMTPLKGTSQLRGCRCSFSEYSIKFYDKTFEAIKSSRIPIVERDKVPVNLLRYEIKLSRKQLKNKGFTNVTGSNLLSPLHYIRFKRLMKKIFDKIVFDDIEVDYTGYLENDIKRYIFAKSDRYDYYLQCLKNYFGVAEYRKEKRRTNELLKRMDSLPKGELTAEIKSKFEIAMSKI